MKKYFLMAATLIMGAAMFTSCSKDDEPKETTCTVTFEGEYFTKLIDNPQYGGPLIYSPGMYTWQDATSMLASYCEKADWTEYGMGYGWDKGIAISNYIDNSTTVSYDKQLSVPESNGSSNFAVVWENGSQLSFADGKARVIKSMDVCLTTYTLRNIQKNCGEGYEFKVIAEATLADGTTKSLDIVMAKDKAFCEKWMTASLESLGAVKSLTFTFDGTDKSTYGLSTPKYFAFDNVVVVL